MFCMKCGTQLPDDALFCYKCGNKVAVPCSVNEEVVVSPQKEEASNFNVEQPANVIERNEFTDVSEDDLLDIAQGYETGCNGKAQDISSAIRVYQELANRGNSFAEFKLSQLNGNFIPVVEAVPTQEYSSNAQVMPVNSDVGLSRFDKMLKKANAGNVLAQIGLAEAYLNGNGCEANKDKAIEWYQKAADQGDEDAKKALASLKPESSSGGGFWGGLFKIGAALVGAGAYMYQESHLTSTIIDDVKFAFHNNKNCFVKGNIPQKYFDNAMNAYAGAYDVKIGDVCLLFDDTILLDGGSVGFMVTDGRIITSRKEKLSFTEIDRIYLNGMDIMVRNTKGVTSCIYTVDTSTEGLSELFSRITKKLAEIRAERDENITNNPNFKL